jgi:ubiquinone/menaquinone biosynthesis C-methylase UbiE
MNEASDLDIKMIIRERYGARAKAILTDKQAACCGPETNCCGSTPTGANNFSAGIYAVDELDGLPLKAALATLGCANPIALAELKEGETVLDIGSGAGLDVILSARRVGPTGHAYGIDMTDEMLELAWHHALDAGVGNVTFIKGEGEALPIPDESVDVVISNCVINLSPDKDRVLSEIKRVLRPGGRLAVADVVTRGNLPEDSPVTNVLRRDPIAWGSCLAGALSDVEYQSKLEAVGFENIGLELIRTHNAEELLGSPLPVWSREFPRADLDDVMSRFTSTFIRAQKPGTPNEDVSIEDSTTSIPDESQSFVSHRIQEVYEQCASNGESDLCCCPSKIYTPEELARLPEDVLRLSSSCGTPVSSAGIERGATVVDIGSGAGADCFLAAEIVGPAGRVIGVDPSPTMREIANQHRDELKLDWVNFCEGTAERLPIPDASADVVISNCVLSLASDPVMVWSEIARVLRPGGRFVVSDVIGGVRPATLNSKARCETGLTWPEYRRTVTNVQFTGVELLRVHDICFRDGHQAQSITVQGQARMPQGRTVQLFTSDQHLASAEYIAELFANVGHQRGAQILVRIRDLSDQETQALLSLVLEEDLMGWDRETWPSLAIVGEGRLLASWYANDGEDPLAEPLVELSMQNLLINES